MNNLKAMAVVKFSQMAHRQYTLLDPHGDTDTESSQLGLKSSQKRLSLFRPQSAITGTVQRSKIERGVLE